MLGRSFDDEDIQEFAKNEWTFNVLECPEGQCMVEIPGKEEPVKVVEAAGTILKGIKEVVEHHYDRQLADVKAVVAIQVCDNDK